MTHPKHGSPADRGHSDAYYGRSPRPHKWTDGMSSSRVELTDKDEIAEYFDGYDSCDEFKDWR